MTLNVIHIPEPRLLFGNKGTALDPRIGLLNFGPNGLDAQQNNIKIQVGAIGSFAALTQLQSFLGKLMHALAAPVNTFDKPWRVDFPGLGINGLLGFEFELKREAVQPITDKEETKALATMDRYERINRVLNLYETKLADLSSITHPPISLILLPISEDVMNICKEPGIKGDKIIAVPKNIPDDEYDEDLATNDFHNALKVLTFPHKIPCQILRPSTLQFKGTTQDPATVAWNISAAMYYKATGYPWKLAQIDNATCIVGITFYKELSKDGSSMRASIAHVYVKNAESQVLLGKPFKWKETREQKEPNLSVQQAEELISDVLSFFRRLRSAEGLNSEPRRVVIHKTSPFTKDEIDGFNYAIGTGPQADFIHIAGYRSTRFYHEKSGYPPVRGTFIYDPKQSNPAYLYTVGFIPALRTYPGSTTPVPLVLDIARLDTTHEQIAEDIMALTKLDWNTTDFCSRLPVTISVSRKVGHILSEARARNIVPPTPYRFFM